jgi:hypothetical protein
MEKLAVSENPYYVCIEIKNDHYLGYSFFQVLKSTLL